MPISKTDSRYLLGVINKAAPFVSLVRAVVEKLASRGTYLGHPREMVLRKRLLFPIRDIAFFCGKIRARVRERRKDRLEQIGEINIVPQSRTIRST